MDRQSEAGTVDWREDVIQHLLGEREDGDEKMVRELRRHSPDKSVLLYPTDHRRVWKFIDSQDSVVSLISGSCDMADDSEDKVTPYLRWVGFSWQGATLEAIMLPGYEFSTCLIGDSEAVASFAETFEAIPEAAERQVLRYSGYEEIKVSASDWDDLALPDKLLQEVRKLAEEFVKGRDTFAAMGCAWTRNILLTGPAGSGKTALCMALGCSQPEINYYYVDGFSSRREEYESDNKVARLFREVRKLARCIVVFEGIDFGWDYADLVRFHEQMNNMSDNNGLFIVVTAGDQSEANEIFATRPGYFGACFQLRLPATPEREAFVQRMLRRLGSLTGSTEPHDSGTVAAWVAQTEQFNFTDLNQVFMLATARLMCPGTDFNAQDFPGLLDEQIVKRAAFVSARQCC